jgi:LPXTG-motif cell wall-anchored protein
MKRLLLLVAVIGALNLLAAPAMAQRDPFDPLVTEEAATSGSGQTSGSADDSGSGQNNDGAPVVEDSALPATGSGTSWFAVAYVLIAAGDGFVVLGRVLNPSTNKRK